MDFIFSSIPYEREAIERAVPVEIDWDYLQGWAEEFATVPGREGPTGDRA